MTYEKAKVICGSAQHKMEDVRINITWLQNDFKKTAAFWVPEVSLDSTRGILSSLQLFFYLCFIFVNSLCKVRFTSILNQRMLFNVSDQCTSVVSRDNETLEMIQANCSFPKIGFCINTSCEYKSILKISFSVH